MRYGNTPRRYGQTDSGADADFVGQIDYVGAEPEFVSGVVPAVQTVSMTITEVHSGDMVVGDTIDLDVLVVAGNPNIGIGESGLPALDPSLVQTGSLLAASASTVDDRLLAFEVRTDGPSSPTESYAGRYRYRR